MRDVAQAVQNGARNVRAIRRATGLRISVIRTQLTALVLAGKVNCVNGVYRWNYC